MKAIRLLLGYLTFPRRAKQGMDGRWWLDCHHDELPSNPWSDNKVKYHYLFTYQQIDQDFWGRWEKVSRWIGGRMSIESARLQSDSAGDIWEMISR